MILSKKNKQINKETDRQTDVICYNLLEFVDVARNFSAFIRLCLLVDLMVLFSAVDRVGR